MATKQHVVTGPLVIARDEEGRDLYVYQGSVLPSTVSAEEKARLVETGLVEVMDVADAPSPDADLSALTADPDETPAADSGDKPSGNASQEEWAAYAVSKGMPEEDAMAMSRNDLRDKYAG